MMVYEKRCGNCQWWTHEHGAVDIDKPVLSAICGKEQEIVIFHNGDADHVVVSHTMKTFIITDQDTIGCPYWEEEVPFPLQTDTDIDILIAEHCLSDITEEDDVTGETWKIMRGDN